MVGDVDLILLSARVLFSNGQTTERTVVAVEQLAEALGLQVTVFPRWGELILCIDSDTGSRYEIIAAVPLGVDMSKVAATDGTTAFLIILAMTFGLIVPRMCIKRFQRSLAKLNPRGLSECIL